VKEVTVKGRNALRKIATDFIVSDVRPASAMLISMFVSVNSTHRDAFLSAIAQAVQAVGQPVRISNVARLAQTGMSFGDASTLAAAVALLRFPSDNPESAREGADAIADVIVYHSNPSPEDRIFIEAARRAVLSGEDPQPYILSLAGADESIWEELDGLISEGS
jgi:hypothetical protein